MGILSLLAPSVGGVASSVASIINTKKTNEANREMAKFAYNKDLEMWNRQNSYNSPQAQMERYKNAGLNPNLIYGTGTASAGNASTLPRYSAPSQSYHYEAPNVMPTIGAYLDTKAKNAQIQSINEDITTKRLNNQILTATILDQITHKKQVARGEIFKADTGFYQSQIKNWEANNAQGFYTTRTNQEMEKSNFIARMLEQQLKNSVMANTLQGKTLERYSADIAGTNLSNEFKSIQNKWYGNAGIKGLNDVLPMLKFMFGR